MGGGQKLAKSCLPSLWMPPKPEPTTWVDFSILLFFSKNQHIIDYIINQRQRVTTTCYVTHIFGLWKVPIFVYTHPKNLKDGLRRFFYWHSCTLYLSGLREIIEKSPFFGQKSTFGFMLFLLDLSNLSKLIHQFEQKHFNKCFKKT